MLKGKESAGAHTGCVDRAALYDRIGTREINIFKHTERAGHTVAVCVNRTYAVPAENDDLAGAYVSYKFGADRIQRAAFRCDDVSSVGRFAVAKRTKAVLVAYCNKLRGRHNDKRIRAFELIHCAVDRLFDGGRCETLLGYYV